MVPWQVPFSASNRFGGGWVTQDSVEPLLVIRSAPPAVLVLFCTQNPVTDWNSRSRDPARCSAVTRLKVTVGSVLAVTAGRVSLLTYSTALSTKLMPLALWMNQPYAGR